MKEKKLKSLLLLVAVISTLAGYCAGINIGRGSLVFLCVILLGHIYWLKV